MKNMKKTLSLLTALILACMLIGCSDSAVPETTVSESTSAAEESETAAPETTEAETEISFEEPSDDRVITVTDMSGDEVTIEGKVESIINLWPAGTSSFFVMGAGNLVSALAVNNSGTVNKWAQFFDPDSADISALGGTTPAIEELVNLDPDLVIIHPMTVSSGYAQQIRDMGIPAINIDFGTYDEMIQSYTMIGEILGGKYQERLYKWCKMVQEKQEQIGALTEGLTEEERPVVYYISGQSDNLTVTMDAGSICADWTDIAGGTYAVSLLEDTSVTELTPEEIFSIDPDVIIIGGIYQHKLLNDIQNTEGWKDLKAVTHGRVYTDPYGCFNWDRFGLESYLQLDYAFMCLQPELASENGIDRESMLQEVIDFYEMMNGTQLTQEEAENMLNGLSPDGTMEVEG